MSLLLVPLDALALLALGLAMALLRLRHAALAARRRLQRGAVKLTLGVAMAFATTLRHLGLGRPPAPHGRRRAGNRTPAETEAMLCRLHVEQPHLGLRPLRVLLMRVASVALSPATVRAILIRRKELVCTLQEARKKQRRRIVVRSRLGQWGVDLTLVWVLGVLPVWLFAAVDYHGSRLLCLRVVRPSATAIVSVLSGLFGAHGTPAQLISDNGGQFVSEELGAFLRAAGVRHVRTRPAHPWTNGRIERLFRSFKELHRFYSPVFLSRRHLTAFCDDFVVYYNSCRPHASCWGFAPDEVFSEAPASAPIGRCSLFDGQLIAHRFI